MTKRRSKEAEMTRTKKVIENVLDAMIQIILLENVQNHRKTRTKEHSSEVLGVIAVKKMMKRLKMKRVSWLNHLMRCSKHMTADRKLFSTYKAYNGGNVIFGINLRGNITDKEKNLSEHDSDITKDGKVIDEEEAIKVIEKKNLENDIADKNLKIYEEVNIKESRNHPLENVIGNLNQKTLRIMVPKGADIETIVYADSDHAGDYVDRKSTRDITLSLSPITSLDHILDTPSPPAPQPPPHPPLMGQFNTFDFHRIPLLYRGEYSQWRERFMNYLEEQKDGEAMINSIQNGDQPLLVIAQVSLAGNAQNAPPTVKDLNNEASKDLWDALEWQMRGSEYGEQDRKAAILYEYETFKAIEGEQLLDTYLRYLQVINDLKKCGYKKDNCDVNDALGYKKKAVVVTSDPLALDAEKTKVNNRKEKVVVSLDSKVSGADDFSELKKITTLLTKAFNRRKFYSKPTNNNLRTSSTSQSANKKQEFVKTDDKKKDFAKDCKQAKVKDYNYYKTKMLLAKKDNDKQVLLAEDQAWMESSSDSDQEINTNIVFMAQIEKIILESDESSSSAEETITEVSYYTSESESESKFETLEYYDNSTNYGLFVNNDDVQEIFRDAIKSASENLIENHIDSQKDYDKYEVDHNDYDEKENLIDKLI
nr:integrase, catalytic region, zinc finger, CCHC-type, peptidase aspartic, catalytic [Tanacetum cinerariifolium]